MFHLSENVPGKITLIVSTNRFFFFFNSVEVFFIWSALVPPCALNFKAGIPPCKLIPVGSGVFVRTSSSELLKSHFYGGFTELAAKISSVCDVDSCALPLAMYFVIGVRV